MRIAPVRRAVAAVVVAFGLMAVALTGAEAVGLGQTCGGTFRFACGSGLWCDWPAGKCAAADVQGKCVEISAACPKSTRPVCGCDRKTYGGDCERVRAGVQKDHDGACK